MSDIVSFMNLRTLRGACPLEPAAILLARWLRAWYLLQTRNVSRANLQAKRNGNRVESGQQLAQP